MQVLSIKTEQLNNEKYSSKLLSQSMNYNTGNNEQIPDEFLSTKTNKKISFQGYSIEYYAQKYFRTSNYRSALIDELRRVEFDGWEKFCDFFNDEMAPKVRRMADKIEARITELVEEDARKNEEAAEEARELRRARQEAREEAEREREEQRRIEEEIEAEIARTNKLNAIELKKTQLSLDKEKLAKDEQALGLDKKLLEEQKLGGFARIMREKFVDLATIEKKQKKDVKTTDATPSLIFPNGIMLVDMDKKTEADLLKWAVKEAGCGFHKVDFNELSRDEALTQLRNIHTESDARRKIVYIENFDKYTRPTQDNETFIGKLKAILSSCADKYKSTIVVNVVNPNHLAPEISAVQRFPVKVTQFDE